MEKEDKERREEALLESWTASFLASTQALAVLMKKRAAGRRALLSYASFQLDAQPGKGNYSELATALEYLGKRYLLPQILHLIHTARESYYPGSESLFPGAELRRVVEFGPGTGWLLREIQAEFGDKLSYSAVDRRILWSESNPAKLDEPSIGLDNYHIVDLETDLEAALQRVPPGPDLLILANNFLHCMDDPISITALLMAYHTSHWIVIEPATQPPSRRGISSFPFLKQQLKLFGATPLDWPDIIQLFKTAGLTHELMSLPIVVSLPIMGQQITLFKPVGLGGSPLLKKHADEEFTLEEDPSL